MEGKTRKMTYSERRAKADELRDEATHQEWLAGLAWTENARRKCLRRAAYLRNEAYWIEFGRKRGQ